MPLANSISRFCPSCYGGKVELIQYVGFACNKNTERMFLNGNNDRTNFFYLSGNFRLFKHIGRQDKDIYGRECGFATGIPGGLPACLAE